MRDDYRARMGRVLPNGGGAAKRDLKFVEVLYVFLRIERAGDEVTIISSDPPATAGTWRLRYEGIPTSDLDFDASAADVQTALEGLDDIDPGDVSATGGPIDTDDIVITFNNPDLKPASLTLEFGSLSVSGHLGFSISAQGPGYQVGVSVLEYDNGDLAQTDESIVAITTGPNWAPGLKGFIRKIDDKWFLENLPCILPCFTNDDLRDPAPGESGSDAGDPGEYLQIKFEEYYGMGTLPHYGRLEETIALPPQGDSQLGAFDGRAEMIAYPLNGMWVCTPKECYDT